MWSQRVTFLWCAMHNSDNWFLQIQVALDVISMEFLLHCMYTIVRANSSMRNSIDQIIAYEGLILWVFGSRPQEC